MLIQEGGPFLQRQKACDGRSTVLGWRLTGERGFLQCQKVPRVDILTVPDVVTPCSRTEQELTIRIPQTNFQSVARNPSVVDKYIESELSTGRLAHPIVLTARRNPIGIIPKPLQPGKFRLIVDLSSPLGGSVNDGIDRNLCSLQYTSVDQAARLVAACGRGA